MDARLVAWARAVKARRREGRAGSSARRHSLLPSLWLFTDAARLPDPLAAAAALPRRLCGVVLRHDDDAERAALGRALARICRDRGLALVVAGDWRLAAALGAGVHLRRGHGPGPIRRTGRVLTSSAHSQLELHRAARAGAMLAFLSPAFATASHPGQAALGARRWSGLARQSPLPVAALGGINGRTVKYLPKFMCFGAGAITALQTTKI